MIRSVWFSKHLSSHLKSTELPPACYSESTASGYEQPIPTDAAKYTSLDQKTLQKNHAYTVKSQPETDMAFSQLGFNSLVLEILSLIEKKD